MEREAYLNPPKEYRPTAFWSWNDRLEPEELKRQISQMEQSGWGGFFMHARAGLQTEYMSEDWMTSIKLAVNEAKEKGMYAWLYDEDGWPSGSCGCTVPRMDESYRETHLYMAVNDIPHNREDIQVLRVYRAKKSFGSWARSYRDHSIDYTLEAFESINPGEAGATTGDDTVVLYFYRWIAPLCNARFRGASYVDLMNPDATRAFIRSTHERYRRDNAPEFGGTIPGIFTDDVTVLWDVFGNKKNALPWTGQLPEWFSREYGYSLLDCLPHLYFPLEGHERVRHHYYRLISKLFAEHYTKVIYDWCGENGLQSTGHLMADDYINLDVMLHYTYMHTPATDHLGLKCRNLMVNRRMQSVASQLGRERTICEVFGGAGQNLTFEQQKAVTDWLAINGVNSLTMHLSLYSMRGLRKRDHPPVLSWQQPWWEYNKTMADYQARLCYALSQGHRVVDVVVIDPVESRSACYSPLDRSLSDKITHVVQQCQETLLRNHYDYELASEAVMAQYGRAGDGRLHIGRSSYKLVIVPKVITLRETTLHLLQEFIASGGRLLLLDALPKLVEGSSSPQQLREALTGAKVVPSYRLAESMRDSGLTPRVSMTLENGEPARSMLYHLREDGDRQIIFLTNQDEANGCKVRLTLDGIWEIRNLILNNGREERIPSQVREKATSFTYDFAPGESMLLQLVGRTAPDSGLEELGEEVGGRITRCIPVSSTWKLELLEANALTLDYCSYSTGGGLSAPAEYVLKVKQRLQSAGEAYALAYSFTADGWNGNGGYVVMEDPEHYTVRLNGKVIKATEGEWWKDPAFRKLPIDGLVQDGVNVLQLESSWLGENVAEAVYVIGDFQVHSEEDRYFTIRPRRKEECTGNLSNSGCLFYAGNAVLHNRFTVSLREGRRYVLQLERLDAVLAEVRINGRTAGEIWHKPYKLDITSYLVEGENHVALKLAGTLHNLLGPHHMDSVPDNPFISPFSFEDYRNWQEGYYGAPFGVQGAVVNEEDMNPL
ncbi:glycosyl hydrolase [Gorillibacterium sp. sgz5001074]|uniref:glycosyl hydrolase n=1 Tax=Gorillibacterium sp. sgz5001074 TaxID=3446695 RepID=UPI003F6743EA